MYTHAHLTCSAEKKGKERKRRLLARRNEHALSLSVVVPPARSCFAAVLLGVPFDPLLEFGSEVSDQTL